MLFPNEKISMVVGIAGLVLFVIAIVILLITCKIGKIICCHVTQQESRAELDLVGKEGIRESAVYGDQSPTLQRYVTDPTLDSKLTVQEADEQGDPKYDYARTGEISKCTYNESQKSTAESGDHKKEDTSKNEKEAMTKVDEHAVIETTEVKRKKKTHAKKPTKRMDLKSGAVHYENETEDTSVKKKEKANANSPNKRARLKSGTAHYENEPEDSSANDVTEDESVLLRKTDIASDLYENESGMGASNKRQGNESNLYESMHDMPHTIIAVDIDIVENNRDSIAVSGESIRNNMSHNKLKTDEENESEQKCENVPLKRNNMENKDKEHGERFENRDAYSTRESQGSDLSNESRKSDESEKSNDSYNSASTDISVRPDNTPKPTSPTNSCQDSNATYVNIYAKNVNMSAVINMNKA